MKSVEFTKSFTKSFYDCTLPQDYDQRQLLRSYFANSEFDINRFVFDARKSEKPNDHITELYHVYLPDELLAMTEDECRSILNEYRKLAGDTVKGGFVRFVIKKIFDSRFIGEFNRLANDFLKHEYDDILEEYLKNFGFAYDFSFTERKQLKSVVEGKREKLNPCSAYKLFGQGEYSKLLMGYVADEKHESNLKDLRAKGFSSIFSAEDICVYKREDGREINVVPFFNRDYSEVFNTSMDEKAIARRRVMSSILDMQVDVVNKILQTFNGSYVPYDLDSTIEEKSGKKDSDGNIACEIKTSKLREMISDSCRVIYFKNIGNEYHSDKIEKYGDGRKYSSGEIQFIKRYFAMIADNVPAKCREKFNDATSFVFSRGEENVSINEKIEAINNVIGSKVLEGHPYKDTINSLSSNEKWNAICAHRELEISYWRGDALPFERKNYDAENISKAACKLLTLFDRHFHFNVEFMGSLERYIKCIDSEKSIRHISDSKKNCFKSALKDVLPGKKKEVAEYLENLESIDFNEIEKTFFEGNEEGVDKLKMVFAIWCLDKERSWDGIWNSWYKPQELNPTLSESDVEKAKKIFRECMYDVYSNFLSEIGV